MRTKFVGLVATIAVLAAGVPMIAHHSFAAEFDIDQPITLSNVQRVNPLGIVNDTRNWTVCAPAKCS